MARNQIDKRSEYTVTLYPDELEAVGHDRRTAEEAHAYMMERGAKCLRCPLFGLRAGPVRSELRPGAPLLVCGDVPEQDDVDSKRPFVGRAGLMLEEAAWEGGVAREEASFANAISCRPPEEYAAYTARVRIEYEKRVKEAEEAGLPVPPEVLMPEEACHPRLMTDIAEAKPLVALALGVSAVKAVAAAYDVPYGAKGRKARVGEAKISSLKRVLGSPVCPPGKPIIIATYHPAWTARQGNKHYGHIVHGHIAKAARIAARGGRLDWKDADITTLDPTIEQVRETFARFAAHAAPVYCDIETDSAMARTATLRCIGYGQLRADGLWEVIVVPFRRIDGTAFWSPEDEAVLRAECLAFHKQVRLVGHNFVMFDSEKLLREGLLDDWTQSFGDCYLDSATEFLTVRGWLKYDEIGAADKLATIDAAGAIEFQPYFDRVARQYTGSVYEVMTQYSRAIVTPTHRMLVSAVGRRPDAGWRFVPLKTLLDAKHSSFNIRTAPAGVSVSVRRDSADGVDLTPDFLTFLGLVISDGCMVTADGVIRGVTVSQKLGGKAEAELLRLQSVLGLKRTEHVHYESWRSAPIIEVHWSIFSTQLANRIHAWTGQYAATKHLPPWYMELDTAQRLALMRGLMLGDGSHDRKAHKYRTFSHRLRDDVQVLALSLGIPASHHIDGECYAVSMRPDKGQTALVRMRADVRTSNGRIRTRQVRDARIVCFSVPNESLVTRAGGRVAFHGNTMLKHRNTIANDAPHSLGFCISQYTEAPAHKDDANDKYLDGGADDTALHGYCAKDVHRTGVIDQPLTQQLVECETEAAYATDFKTAPTYRSMGDLGMVIDIAKHREMWIKFETQRRALIKRAQDVVGDDKFNPNAPDQVRDFLYRKKGLIPVISTQKGKEWRPGDDPSTNANALQQLILKRALDEQTTQFIDALSKYRAVSKVVGSYIEGLVKDRTPKADLSDEDEEDIKGAPDPAKDLEAYIDWRYARISEVTNTTVTRELYPDLGELFMLHPQYKMHIPTGRVSTTPTIQNWPVIGVANMRELGIVPRGYKFVGADFEQIELRLYAVIADDQVVLEAFHNGLDVHTLNYATLRARNPSDMDEVMRIYHETVALKKRGDEGDKKAKNDVKAWRTLAKRFVYLICYGGETERLFATMSTDRDKATGELLFKGLTPQQVSIMYNNWHTVHPWTIQWQEREVAHAKQHGWIQAILDGRKRHFPGGLNKRNAAPNAKIQGSAAAITNRAVEILGGLIRHREWGIMSGLNLQIHDYIGAYVPAARADEAARMIQESMETTYMGMPFPAVPVISESWATQ